jgi:hypothetical protein
MPRKRPAEEVITLERPDLRIMTMICGPQSRGAGFGAWRSPKTVDGDRRKRRIVIAENGQRNHRKRGT